GFAAQSRAELTLSGSAIVAARDAAVYVSDDGSQATAITGNVIDGTLPPEDGTPSGAGIVVAAGATAKKVDANAVTGSAAAGIIVQGKKSVLEASGNLVTGTLPGAQPSALTNSILVESGAQATLDDNAVYDNHDLGIVAQDEGTVLTANGNVVE